MLHVWKGFILSPFKRAIYQDIVNSLAQCKRFLDKGIKEDGVDSEDSLWRKYCILLGKWLSSGSHRGKQMAAAAAASSDSQRQSLPPYPS